MADAFLPSEGRLARARMLKEYCDAHTTWLMLIKADFTVAAGLEYADLTEADFPGYSHQAPDFLIPIINGDGDGQTDSETRDFQRSSTGTVQNIYGWALVSDPGGGFEIVSVRKFTSPIPVENMGDTISVRDREIMEAAA